MPFGQSFFISRLVGGVVEAVTGDKETARTARNITRVVLLVATLDVGGHILHSVADHAADAATDHLSDTAIGHAADTIVPHFSSASGVIYDRTSDLVAGYGHDAAGNAVDSLGYPR